MNIEYIKQKLQYIEDRSYDPEVAHSDEDALYLEFIEYVAKNPNDPELAQKAALVLQSQTLDFPRWCA